VKWIPGFGGDVGVVVWLGHKHPCTYAQVVAVLEQIGREDEYFSFFSNNPDLASVFFFFFASVGRSVVVRGGRGWVVVVVVIGLSLFLCAFVYCTVLSVNHCGPSFWKGNNGRDGFALRPPKVI